MPKKGRIVRDHEAKARNSDGVIFNIQRFSLHDGPGIRTTVFLKGCPLTCKRCSNPEGIDPYPELMTIDRNCVRCFKCQEICSLKAIRKTDGRRVIDREKCNLCFDCVEACLYDALKKAGQTYGIDELVREIEKDRLFYVNSGGGITFSGGEPLLQAQFTKEVFKICRQKMISTALDTCGYASWPIMEKVLESTDLVLYDIKQMDPHLHQKGTSRVNGLILENFKKTIKIVRTWVRVPLIPNFNDSDAFIEGLSLFISKLGNSKIEKVSFLPYHSWGDQKYEKLGREYEFGEIGTQSKLRLEELKEIVESYGIPVTVGN